MIPADRHQRVPVARCALDHGPVFLPCAFAVNRRNQGAEADRGGCGGRIRQSPGPTRRCPAGRRIRGGSVGAAEHAACTTPSRQRRDSRCTMTGAIALREQVAASGWRRPLQHFAQRVQLMTSRDTRTTAPTLRFFHHAQQFKLGQHLPHGMALHETPSAHLRSGVRANCSRPKTMSSRAATADCVASGHLCLQGRA